MNLFNRKTLKRHIKPAPIPADHLAALDAWAEMIRSGRVYALKETALHGQFAAKIIEGVLGYHGPAGGADYTVATEQAILRGSVDLALGRFGGKTPEILAPFELKGADTRDLDAIMPGRNKTPVQQAWETAFPSVFAEGGFDVVLGNPPYVRMEHLKALKPYLEKRYEVVSDRADLYCYFFERGLRLLKPGGRLGVDFHPELSRLG
jgi:hypothetical protein